MVSLGDLAEINHPRSSKKIDPEDIVSFIPMADITEGGRWINRQSRKYKEVRQGFTYFEEGDVLFAKITPCMENGKGCHAIGLDNGIGFGTTEFHVLRAREDADPGFIYQWSIYHDLRRQAKNSMTGSAGQQRVPKEFFKKFLVPLISKPEQTKIAEILSTVDRAIEQTEALIVKQQRIKTGLMQDLLTRGIDEHGNLRSEKTHQFKDSPLGRIPVEWEVDELETVCEFVTSGSRGWAQYYSSEGAMFLRIGNLTRDHINLRLEDMAFVNPPRTSEGKRTSVSPGDLLISITADLGIIGVIPVGFGEGYVNQHIALVRLLPEKANSRFIGWFLSGQGGQNQFEKLNESGAKAGLNLPTIRKLLVPIINPVEQKRIAEILDANSNWVSDLYSKLRKHYSLKTALMLDLLTGKRRVVALLNSTMPAN